MNGVPPITPVTVLGKTLRQLRLPVITIAFILSIATVMNYSGMTSSMALALAKTGVLFPFFSAWLGMIGVFLTGSDTSSNTLFGPLQATTAKISGLDPILMGATNSSGGVMGKMISPQHPSVGAAGVGAVGGAGVILGAATTAAGELPVVAPAQRLAEQRRLGLLRSIPLRRLPRVCRFLLGFLLLDYTLYLWHWLNHRVPVLWRFHAVHHLDRDLDST